MPDDASSCSPSTSTAQPTPAAAPPPAKRISKACEPCRARRTRCDGDQPCKKCVAAGGLTCTYRTKARPMRRPRLVRPFSLAQSGGSGAADSDGVALQGLRTIEASLERQYEERTGTSISLTLPDADTHPALAPDAPLPLLPTVADSILDALCQTFVREVLVFFPFLSSTRIHQLEQRRRDMPDTLTPEQRALLYSVFAMGYLRQASSVFATDKALPVPIDPTLARLDVAYFRHAVELVQLPASPTALEALNILMLYALSTASVETTRSVLSKLCWGIHELGLHKQTTAGAYPAEFSISSTLFMSVWNDVYIAGLTGHPPFLRDVDTDLLSQSAECGGIAAPGMAQLVLLEADLLREAHQNPARLRDPAFVLAHDAKLFAFLKQYGSQTLDYTNMANVFNQTHFHFQKLLLRAPSSTDAVLGPSSLAILSRSAMHLLRHYERVFLSTRVNNCVWPVLVRTVGAGHAVLQALWHGDIVRIEAEEAMGKVMWLLDKLSTRWTVAAAAACANFTALCTALEIDASSGLTPATTPLALPVPPPLMPPTFPAPPAPSGDTSAHGVLPAAASLPPLPAAAPAPALAGSSSVDPSPAALDYASLFNLVPSPLASALPQNDSPGDTMAGDAGVGGGGGGGMGLGADFWGATFATDAAGDEDEGMQGGAWWAV